MLYYWRLQILKYFTLRNLFIRMCLPLRRLRYNNWYRIRTSNLNVLCVETTSVTRRYAMRTGGNIRSNGVQTFVFFNAFQRPTFFFIGNLRNWMHEKFEMACCDVWIRFVKKKRQKNNYMNINKLTRILARIKSRTQWIEVAVYRTVKANTSLFTFRFSRQIFQK